MTNSRNILFSFLVLICKVSQLLFTHAILWNTTCILLESFFKLIEIRITFLSSNFSYSLILNFSFFTFIRYVWLSYLFVDLLVIDVIFFVPRDLLTCFNGGFDESTTLDILFNNFTLFLDLGKNRVRVWVAHWTRSWS